MFIDSGTSHTFLLRWNIVLVLTRWRLPWGGQTSGEFLRHAVGLFNVGSLQLIRNWGEYATVEEAANLFINYV